MYDFSSRSVKYHRALIREGLGFRECTEADQQGLAGWLSREVCPTELRREALRDAVIAHCRSEKMRLEPPTFGQISRLVGSALRMFEDSSVAGSSSGSMPRVAWLTGWNN